MLSWGEFLALEYIELGGTTGKPEEIQPQLNLIEQKTKELFSILLAWHGELKNQSDIPDSFKQATLEAEEGKILDFDTQ